MGRLPIWSPSSVVYMRACVYIYINISGERKEKMALLLLSEATDCTLGCVGGYYYFSFLILNFKFKKKKI